VGTCFEELPELAKLGVDEGVIRGVGGVIYLGERHPCRHESVSFKKFVVWLGGEESVGGTPATASAPLIIHCEDIVFHQNVFLGSDSIP